MSLVGDVEVTAAVSTRFAEVAVEEMARWKAAGAGGRFRLGASGGGSGKACFSALAGRDDFDFEAVELFFADERCVPADSPERNANAIGAAFREARRHLAAIHAMDCEEGPEAYEALLSDGLDLLQLGMGPDGHTASLFPRSPALTESRALVVRNEDPLGNNPYRRLTLTYPGIARASLAVITVNGADKAEAFEKARQGEPLPVTRVRAGRVLWIVDEEAAGGWSP